MKIENVILFLALPSSACMTALKQMSAKAVHYMQMTSKISVIPRLSFLSLVKGFAIKISDIYLSSVRFFIQTLSHSSSLNVNIHTPRAPPFLPTGISKPGSASPGQEQEPPHARCVPAGCDLHMAQVLGDSHQPPYGRDISFLGAPQVPKGNWG